MYRNGIKRLLAVILSLCGMIVLSPLLLILCLAIKIDSPGPIFFRQKRVGIHKQHFNILKFRTMRIDTPHDQGPGSVYHPGGALPAQDQSGRAAPALEHLCGRYGSHRPTPGAVEPV